MSNPLFQLPKGGARYTYVGFTGQYEALSIAEYLALIITESDRRYLDRQWIRERSDASEPLRRFQLSAAVSNQSCFVHCSRKNKADVDTEGLNRIANEHGATAHVFGFDSFSESPLFYANWHRLLRFDGPEYFPMPADRNTLLSLKAKDSETVLLSEIRDRFELDDDTAMATVLSWIRHGKIRLNLGTERLNWDMAVEINE